MLLSLLFTVPVRSLAHMYDETCFAVLDCCRDNIPPSPQPLYGGFGSALYFYKWICPCENNKFLLFPWTAMPHSENCLSISCTLLIKLLTHIPARLPDRLGQHLRTTSSSDYTAMQNVRHRTLATQGCRFTSQTAH